MLSREELEAIRAEVEDPSGAQMYSSDALETILVLLWHIDALEAREKPTPKLPKGARTLTDGSIRLGTGEAQRQAIMRDVVRRRKG